MVANEQGRMTEPEERRTCPICGHVFKSRAVMRNHFINRVCDKYKNYQHYRQYYYGRKNRKTSESEERDEKVQG